MNIALFVAQRYLISKKKRNFINFISILSVAGVAVGTMALIIVLSVFNGLEEVIRNIYGSFDPDIKITATEGKSFIISPDVEKAIKALPELKYYSEAIEDNALLKYSDKQTVVKIKGVSSVFASQYKIKEYITEGQPVFERNGMQFAIAGRGIQYKLGIDMKNHFFQLQFWYPKNNKNVQLNPESAFNSANLFPGGIFALEKQYDDSYVFVPLEFASNLMSYGKKRTSLELNYVPGTDPESFKSKLKDILGENFTVLTRDEQHVSMLRAVKIEKMFMYVTFSFIMMVCSLNIFFTLTMLAIEKKRDINILYSMGASPNLIKNVFLSVGFIIAVVGALAGLLLGFIICHLQQTYGLVTMGTETSLINTYPIRMRIFDFISTGSIIMVITFLISYQPAWKASRMADKIS